MPQTLSTAYRRRLAAGEIVADPGQVEAMAALADLEQALNAMGEPSAIVRLFHRPAAPRGVYLFGPVGRGKSMLMDLFFETAPIEKKRRAHFQAFMAEVHGLIGEWRRGSHAERKARFGHARGDDPIAPTAELIASGARLLCFDELQVTDPADAMILGRLFEALFEQGVVLVATSNRPPDDLYKDGLNRELFLPFIAMLKARMRVVQVSGDSDHRLERLRGARVYFSPDDKDNTAAFDDLWRGQLGGDAETGAEVEVLGRTLKFPRAAGGLLRATFEDLCGQPLGSQDYLAVAARFHTVFLEGVPRLTAERRNEAWRLIWLVDALYEAGTRLVILAEVEPDRLYGVGDGAYEFARTTSRLHQMRSAAWLEGRRD